MYTDQTMDNLIRAHNGMVFVQLNYRDLLVQDTDMVSGGGAGGWSGSSTHSKSIAGFVSRMYGWTAGVNASASRAKIMSFHADPITDKNDIYDLYLAFASNPALFAVSDHKPGCPVHLMRQCCGKCYWIPADAGPAFLQLVLKTTMQRGPESVPSPAYDVQIADVKAVEKAGEKTYTGIFYFTTTVPNGEATMIVHFSDKTKARIELRPIFKAEKAGDPDINEGEMTKRLRGNFEPALLGIDPQGTAFAGAKAELYSHRFPRLSPPSNPALQQINDTLDRIRAQQPTNGL